MTRPFTWPYVPRLDRSYKAIGTYQNGFTTWTLPYNDPLVNRIVLGNGFGDLAGAVLVPVQVTANRVSVLGDFTLDYCMLGREFASTATINKPMPRGMSGMPIHRGTVVIREIVTRHFNSANYWIVSEWTGQGSVRTRSKKFQGRVDSNNLVVFDYDGKLVARHNGNAKNMDITIVNNDTRPHTIVSVEVMYDFADRR